MHEHVLHTPRLTLRALQPGDVDDVYAYANDPEWSRDLDLAVPSPYSRQDAVRWVAIQVEGSEDELPFAVVLDGAVVGSTTIRLDERNQAPELGWSLRRDHWGQGYMTEAASALVDFSFRSLDAERVWARAFLRNPGSWRVMEKLGMTREGLLRQHRVDRAGERVDEVVYGLLRSEWELRHAEA